MDMNAPRDGKEEPEAIYVDDKHRDYSPSSPDPEKSRESEDDRLLANWSEQEQSALIRKVDWRLIPLCGIMYCVSLLDRTNLSNAAIAGMTVELELSGASVDRYVGRPLNTAASAQDCADPLRSLL